MKSDSGKEVEQVKQVVADKFQVGAFSKTWWCRADFKCPVCKKRHVVMADGRGETTPDEITTTCKATGEVLVVKPWSPTK